MRGRLVKSEREGDNSRDLRHPSHVAADTDEGAAGGKVVGVEDFEG